MSDTGFVSDVLNDLLFEHMQTEDGTVKVIWVGQDRWMVVDVETPEIYVVQVNKADLTLRQEDG